MATEVASSLNNAIYYVRLESEQLHNITLQKLT